MATCTFLCVPAAQWAFGTALSSFPTIFVPWAPAVTSGQRYGRVPHSEVTGSLPVCQDQVGQGPVLSAELSLWSPSGLTCLSLSVCLFQAMWMMLQLKEPEDFVIATGEVHSVREFVEKAFKHVGKTIVWVYKKHNTYHFETCISIIICLSQPSSSFLCNSSVTCE